MREWNIVKLGDIAEFSNGINFDKTAYAKGIRLIGVSNFGNRFFPPYEELAEVKKEIVRQNDYLEKDDIVFVRSNGNKELVGRCMLIDDVSIPLTYSGFCIRCRLINKQEYNPIFFTYYFKSKLFRRAMSGTAVGANIQNLSQGRLASHTLKVPNYETQIKIADVLFSYEKYIDNNQKQIKLLEEAAQRLYKEWFVDLKFPGHENVEIVDGVPEGWYKDTVDSRISLLSGYAFKSSDFVENGHYKIVTIKNVKDGDFDAGNVSLMNEIPSKMPKHCILEEGDILLSLTGNVGRVCLVYGENYLLNQRVAKLKSDISAFTYCLFRSKDMFDEMNNLANGAAQQNLSPIRTGKIRICFPSEGIIQRFEGMVKPIIDKVIELNKMNGVLTEARDRLLPKLMSGEIEL